MHEDWLDNEVVFSIVERSVACGDGGDIQEVEREILGVRVPLEALEYWTPHKMTQSQILQCFR